MNTQLVDSAPPGDFEEISIGTDTPKWMNRFEGLVQEGKRIKYQVSDMPILPESIRRELNRSGYCDHILRNTDQHFLVPKSH